MWYKFKDKLPELGSNILLKTNEGLIGTVEFDLEVQRIIKHNIETKTDSGETYLIEFYSDDPEDTNEYDIICAEWWTYPSKITKNTMNWINVTNRLPPQDCYVLVANFDNRPKVQMFFIHIAKRINKEWFDDYNEEKMGKCNVTHWMPLPDAPDSINFLSEINKEE